MAGRATVAQGQLQRPRNGLSDVVLHRKDIVEIAVVALRPEMECVLGVDQLRGNPQATAGGELFSCRRSQRSRPDIDKGLADVAAGRVKDSTGKRSSREGGRC